MVHNSRLRACCWPSTALRPYQEAPADRGLPETLATVPSAVDGDGYVWPENGTHVSQTGANKCQGIETVRHSCSGEPQDRNTLDISLKETTLEADL